MLYQLALIGVGRGVAEHSTTLVRPLDRLRTTLTTSTDDQPHAEVREVLGLTWSRREQKLYDRFLSVNNRIYPVLPAFLRKAHARLIMRDFRRRIRKGSRVI